jgi:hypothetical protein
MVNQLPDRPTFRTVRGIGLLGRQTGHSLVEITGHLLEAVDQLGALRLRDFPSPLKLPDRILKIHGIMPPQGL